MTAGRYFGIVVPNYLLSAGPPLDYERHIARRLHDEHLASLGLLARLEAAIARPAAPAAGDRPWAELARAVCAAFEDEVERHFAFEEAELFPRLAQAGEPGIGLLLSEEHDTIRACAGALLPMLQASAGGEAPDWSTLRATGLEFVERMQGHIQKEEMGLLPMIEDLVDAETDATLALAYAA